MYRNSAFLCQYTLNAFTHVRHGWHSLLNSRSRKPSRLFQNAKCSKVLQNCRGLLFMDIIRVLVLVLVLSVLVLSALVLVLVPASSLNELLNFASLTVHTHSLTVTVPSLLRSLTRTVSDCEWRCQMNDRSADFVRLKFEIVVGNRTTTKPKRTQHARQRDNTTTHAPRTCMHASVSGRLPGRRHLFEHLTAHIPR